MCAYGVFGSMPRIDECCVCQRLAESTLTELSGVVVRTIPVQAMCFTVHLSHELHISGISDTCMAFWLCRHQQ